MPANDFRDKLTAYFNALIEGDNETARRILVDDIATMLDKGTGAGGNGGGIGVSNAPRSASRTSRITQQMLNMTAGNVQSPLNTQSTTRGTNIVEGEQTSYDINSGKSLRMAKVADGQSVLPAYSVYVVDNVAWLASPNDNRPCHGVCVRGSGNAREIYWREGGTVVARVKRGTAVSGYGTLYQSVTPGVLTNDPNDAGSNPQAVGHFKDWTVPRAGEEPMDTAEINLTVTFGGSGGGGGGGGQTMTGTAMETIAEGDLVHCDNDGNMWVARADSQFRYAVGVATVGGGASDTVTIAIGGEANVKVTADSFYDHTNTYYLSETAGAASCAPVAVTDNTKVWQCIGFGVGPVSSGKMPMRLTIDSDWIWV